MAKEEGDSAISTAVVGLVSMSCLNLQPKAQRAIRYAAAVVCLSLFIVSGGSLLANRAKAQADEDFFHLGVIEYEISCLPCHGDDGRGDGPDADFLETQPADLTGIAKANGGEFPAERLRMVVDGRALVADHGQRAMPVWGERYRTLASEAGTADAEQEARTRIEALVDYIESLQEP
jgi:hypothetical protein